MTKTFDTSHIQRIHDEVEQRMHNLSPMDAGMAHTHRRTLLEVLHQERRDSGVAPLQAQIQALTGTLRQKDEQLAGLRASLEAAAQEAGALRAQLGAARKQLAAAFSVDLGDLTSEQAAQVVTELRRVYAASRAQLGVAAPEVAPAAKPFRADPAGGAVAGSPLLPPQALEEDGLGPEALIPDRPEGYSPEEYRRMKEQAQLHVDARGAIVPGFGGR